MMTRIRTVKPELFSHEGLFDMEQKYQLPLRLAFIALFTCCDRKGRFRWQPRRLKHHMLPYDDIDPERLLNVLEECHFVVKYEHQGEFYGYIPSWSRHQYINSREKGSLLPSPEAFVPHELEQDSENNEDEEKNQEDEMDDPTVSDACSTREVRVTCMHEGKGIERNGKGTGTGKEGNRSLVASVTRQSSTNDQPIAQIFEHWKTLMKHPNAILDRKRRAQISKALQSGYGVQQLCQAIIGCSLTPHNIGDNERGQRYDGLHVILRDADQIDRFIHNCESPPHPLTEAERRAKANVILPHFYRHIHATIFN